MTWIEKARRSPLPRYLQVAWLVVVCIWPTRLVINNYQPYEGFIRLIFFGQVRHARAVPEVRFSNITWDTPCGYDGQFYAQVALDPLLLRPETPKAMDNPTYRTERPVMTMLSYLLGLGRPDLILQVYAVLNLFFWYLLIIGLLAYAKPVIARDFLCITAIVLTDGVIVSIQRALTDLPAATLGFCGLISEGLVGSVLIAASILTKPTMVLFIFPHLTSTFRFERRFLYRCAIVFLVPAAWMLYLKLRLGGVSGSDNNLGIPGYAFMRQIGINYYDYVISTMKHPWGWGGFYDRLPAFWDLIMPISLLVQFVYFAVHRNFRCPWWMVGALFSILCFSLTSITLVERVAFLRAMIPLTLAFNLKMWKESLGVFRLYFYTGNIGLVWFALQPIFADWLINQYN